MPDTKLFTRLKRLFSSNVVVRNVGGSRLKVSDTSHTQAFTNRALHDRFNRVHYRNIAPYAGEKAHMSLAYQGARLQLFRDYDIMDNDAIIACIEGDTRVMTLEGPQCIRDLATKYANGETFEVWSWDNTQCKYTIGQAHSPRKTGTSNIVEVELDNGKILRCTANHKIMLADGTYKDAGLLRPADSIMPFEYKNKEYMHVRIPNSRYIPAHRYIYEHIFNENVDGKNIHHINHKKYDNRTTNLESMSPIDHVRLHGKSLITNRKRGKTVSDLWKDDDYREIALSGLRKWQSSHEGKKFMSEHTSHLNKVRWATDVDYATKMARIFSNHAKKLWSDPTWALWKRAHHSYTMKLKYANDPTYRFRVANKGSSNGRYNNNVTTEWILNNGCRHDSLSEFTNHPKFDKIEATSTKYKSQFVVRRLNEAGYDSWKHFKQEYVYTNHLVSNVRFVDDIVDVYDLTVDHFENFAIEQGIIISNSALDIYADEVTVRSETGESLIIESSNEQVREILHNLFYDVLNIEFNLWPWVRNMCKYGDHFLYLEIAEKYGIINVMPLPVYETVRIEGDNPDNPYEVYFNLVGTTSALDRFENYEIAHFRLLSDSNFLPYGKAMIEPGRRTWKQLVLMEDAMLVHRIVRAPDRRVFRVDIGNIPPQEVDAFMKKMMDKVNKTPLIDPQTGDYNLKFNLMNMLEDFYLPVRGGDSGTQIENLSGLQFTATEDIEYLRNKMMGSLKIPRAFLGYEETLQGKATLAAEDVRFARTIERIQRIITSELNKIATIHLYAQGYEDEELLNFELSLTNPSTIYEQEKLALWQEKVALAQQVQELKLISSEWIYDNVFSMSEDEIEEHRNNVVKDTKRTFRLMAIEQGEDPANPTGTEGNPAESPGAADSSAPPGKVDLSGLPSEDDVTEALDLVPDEGDDYGDGLDDVDLEELGFPSTVTGGRPRERRKMGTDEHPLGRDPLGSKENSDAMNPFPEDRGPTRLRGLKKRHGFTRENFLEGLDQKFAKDAVKNSSNQLPLLWEENGNGTTPPLYPKFDREEEMDYLNESILDIGIPDDEE